ncbi:MAG: hypothetical protein LBT46_00760 [Planctomycetaceae bacterium]|jgi:hypothetical protein|nr:hypothetical protein [Planctomycetaceae bacterium]
MVISFFLYLLGTVGMTLIIVKGVIFQPVRNYIGKKAAQARYVREMRAADGGLLDNQRVQFNQAGEVHTEAGGILSKRTFVEFVNELISCTQCTGFWCGLFCGILLLTPDASVLIQFSLQFSQTYQLSEGHLLILSLHYLLVWFCCGAAGSFAASFGDILLEWVFYNKMVALRELEERDRAVMARETHDNEQLASEH